MFLTLLDMMRLRSGPQDLPADRRLAVLLALAYAAQGFLAARVLEKPDAVGRALLAIAVQFGVILALLNLRSLAERVDQTIAALAGTGFLFGLISILLLSQLDPGTLQPGLVMAYLVLFVWSLVVDAHIYRHALSIRMSMGVLLSVMIFTINFVLLTAVFG